MSVKKNTWGASLPVYVTRKNADGMVGSFHLAAWYVVLAMVLGMVNLVAWLVIALVCAVRFFA